jgi:hypothetical protein
VQALAKELNNWKSGVDLLSLLTRVNKHVVDNFKQYLNNENQTSDFPVEGGKEIGQTPVFVSSLTKPVALE